MQSVWLSSESSVIIKVGGNLEQTHYSLPLSFPLSFFLCHLFTTLSLPNLLFSLYSDYAPLTVIQWEIAKWIYTHFQWTSNWIWACSQLLSGLLHCCNATCRSTYMTDMDTKCFMLTHSTYIFMHTCKQSCGLGPYKCNNQQPSDSIQFTYAC